MRKLTKEERQIISTLQKRGKASKDVDVESAKVKFTQKFPFTAVEIKTSVGTFVGFSKYNYNDRKLGLRYQPSLGERIAFVKAFSD